MGLGLREKCQRSVETTFTRDGQQRLGQFLVRSSGSQGAYPGSAVFVLFLASFFVSRALSCRFAPCAIWYCLVVVPVPVSFVPGVLTAPDCQIL